MGGIVTEHFRLNNAEHFYEALSEAEPTTYYIFIGHVEPWSVESVPGSPNNSYLSSEYDAWRDMVALKRVQASDAAFFAPRRDWSNNTLYYQYNARTTDLATKAYYVLQIDDYNVYKCIDNNNGANSTVKPTGTGTSIISTADGYRWKYMFNIGEADRNKFMLPDWIPVKKITSDDGSDQWDIQAAAANGAIHQIDIGNNGSGYSYHTANVAGANTIAVKLGSTASGNDAFYVDSALYVSSGKGLGELRRIIRYDGSTKYAYMNSVFSIAKTPNTQSQYIVSPRVVIKGDSGSSTSNRATAYVSNTAGGLVRKITMVTEGLNYSIANVTIVANVGSGATAIPVISPPGGHGSDPTHELFAYNVVLNTQFIGAEGNTLFTNNDFRAVGLVRDPLLRVGSAANASIIDQCSRLTLTSVSGDFTADEYVTGDTNGCRAIVTRFSNTNASGTEGILRVTSVTTTGTGKLFEVGGTVTGATSSVTGTISDYTRPALREFTGRILYYEYRQPITRAADQTENVKFIAKF